MANKKHTDYQLYFKVREMIDKIKEEKDKLSKIEKDFLYEHGFHSKTAFLSSYYSYRTMIDEERFNNGDKEYLFKFLEQNKEKDNALSESAYNKYKSGAMYNVID